MTNERAWPGRIVTTVACLVAAGGCARPVEVVTYDASRYTLVAQDGEPAAPESGAWQCVHDNDTGLVWEVKTDEPGLHDWRNTYSWHDPDEAAKPGGLDYRGTAAGGACDGSLCDTWAYPLAVNKAGLCGYSDWRVPSREELATLSHPARNAPPPTIDQRFFPYAQPDEYWSSNDYNFQHDAAWVWNFRYGHDRVEWKKSARPVRLVRGEAQYLGRVTE